MQKTLISPVVTTVTLSEDRDPRIFFQSRDGLYVRNSYQELIVSRALPAKAGLSLTISSFETQEDMLEKDIAKMLPFSHDFSETEVAALIAELVSCQPHGEPGVLAGNQTANLFFTSKCPVSAMWCPSDNCVWWGIVAWGEFIRFKAGTRVFSPIRS